LWLHSLKVAQLLRSAACLHTNQSRSYLNHSVLSADVYICKALQLMKQPKTFLRFGPYEGYRLVQRSVFFCGGVPVSYAAEEYLLLERSTLE